jgi:tRNA pseudouridine-54 N-methylase
MTIKPSQTNYEVSLDGDRLRYLDASERGILLLLGRAFSSSSISKADRLTPGIDRNSQDHWKTMITTLDTTFWYPSVSHASGTPHSNSNNVFLVDLNNTIPSKEQLEKYENLQPLQLPTTQLHPSSAILVFHNHLDREIK